MLPANDTDSTYVGIMKNYNIPEGKVKEKAHIFDSKEVQYVDKKTTGSANSATTAAATTAAVDLDKSYNLYDSNVKEKANLIEKRKVFAKIPSFVMPPSSQARVSAVVKPKAIIASGDQVESKASTPREGVVNGEISSLPPSTMSKSDVSPISSSSSSTIQVAPAVPSVVDDEDTHSRGVPIFSHSNPNGTSSARYTSRSISSDASRWTHATRPSDINATSSVVLNDKPSRFYLQALSERRKLFRADMKIDVLRKEEVQDNNQYNRTSAQQRQMIPTENWYAATIVSVGNLYLTVSYLTIDKTEKLHIVDDARRVRIYLDNFDDFMASHAAVTDADADADADADEVTSMNNSLKKPLQLQSNSSSADSLLLRSSSIMNGRVAKKSSLTNLNSLLDELVLSDSYSSSSDSKSVPKRRHPQRSRLNKSPTSEALTSRRSLRSPTNIPSEFDDDPFSLPYTSSDWIEDKEIPFLGATENSDTRKVMVESRGSDVSFINEQDLDIYETADTIELQDIKIVTASGIAVGNDDPDYHHSPSNLDSIFQFVLTDSHTYAHSVAKSMSPISVETNLTSLTNSKATTYQRGGRKALSPIPVRRNDAPIALTSSVGGMKADGGQSTVMKPTALLESKGALRNPPPRPPNQAKTNEKIMHRTVSDGMQSTPATKDADAMLKRTMSDGMKSTPRMSKPSPGIAVVNVSSRKAEHDRVSEKIIRKSTPLTIPNPPSYVATDAVSMGIASIASSNSRSSGTKSVDKRVKNRSTVAAVDNSKYLATGDISGSTGKLPRSPRSPRSTDPKSQQMRSGPNSAKIPSRPPVSTASVKTTTAAGVKTAVARSSDSQPVEKIIKKTISAGALSDKSGISGATSHPSSDGSTPDNNKDIRRRTSSSMDGVKSEKTSVISEGVKTRTTKADDDDDNNGSISSPKSLVKTAKGSSTSGNSKSRKHMTSEESNPAIKVNTINAPPLHQPLVKPIVSEPESGHKTVMTISSKLNLSLTIDTKPFAVVESKDSPVSTKALRRTRSDLVRKDIVDVEMMPEFQAAKKVIQAVKRQQAIVENSTFDDMDLPGVESFDEDIDSPSKKSASVTTTGKLLKRTKSESMMGLYLPDDSNIVKKIGPSFGTSRAVVQAIRISRDSQVKTIDNDIVSDKQSFHDSSSSALQTMSVMEEDKIGGINIGSDSSSVVPSRPVVKAVRTARGNEESILDANIAHHGASRSNSDDVEGSKVLRRGVSSIELLKDDASKIPGVPVLISKKPSTGSKMLRRTSSDVMTHYKAGAIEAAVNVKTPTEMSPVSSTKPPTESKVLRRTSSDVMTHCKEGVIEAAVNVKTPTEMSPVSGTKPPTESKVLRRTSSDVMTHYKEGAIEAAVNVKTPTEMSPVSSTKPPPESKKLRRTSSDVMTPTKEGAIEGAVNVKTPAEISPMFSTKLSTDSKELRRTSSDVMSYYKEGAIEGAVNVKTPTEMPPVSSTKLSTGSKKLRRTSSDIMIHYKGDVTIDCLAIQPDQTKSTRTSKSKSKSESDEKSRSKSSSHSKDSGIDIGFIGAVINVSQKSKNQKASSDESEVVISVSTLAVEPSVKLPEIEGGIVAPDQQFTPITAVSDHQYTPIKAVSDHQYTPIKAVSDHQYTPIKAVSDHQYTPIKAVSDHQYTPIKAVSDHQYTPIKVVASATQPDYNFIMSPENYLQVVIDRVVHHGFKSISMDPGDSDDPDPLPETFLATSDTSILVPTVMGGGTPQKLLSAIMNNSTPLSPIIAASPGSAFSTSRYSRRTRALHVSMAKPLATISPPKSIASSNSSRKCYHPKHNKDLLGASYIVLWCGRHCICSNCIKLHSINESHSPLLTCYRCQNHIPEPTNRSKPLFNIPRAANDCAVVTANAIVRKFRPATDRQYISHEDMRSVVNIINHRPYTEGMEYDMIEVLTALENRNFYQTNCIIWHLDDEETKEVVIPDQALLIFLKSPQHFYTYIKMEPNKWRLFDSTHISVKISLTLEELKILLQPFMTSNPQYNTAAVAIINRQPCDINMKSCDLIACRTRVCGKHIVCSKCDENDTRRANRTKNKLFYCNICMDPNTDNRSNVLGEHE